MPWSRIERIGPLLAPLAAFVVFLPAVSFGFVWDDLSLVVANQVTTDLHHLVQALRVNLWASTAASDAPSGYYRPLLLVDLWLDRALFGVAPAAHHLHSILWHVGTVVVAGLLLERRAKGAGWVGALVMALHPAQVEAVTFVSARNDLMAGAFCLLALHAFGRDRVALGALFASLGLLSKELLLILPALTVVWLWEEDRRRLIRGAVAATLAVLAYLAGRACFGVSFGEPLPSERWVLAPVGTAHLVANLLVPFHLSSGLHLAWSTETPWWSLAVAGVLAASCGWALGLRAAAPLAFTLLALAPSLVGVMRAGLVCDRYLYLPMFGVAWLVTEIATLLPVTLRGGFGLGLLVVGALGVSLQLPMWHDPETLWTTVIVRTPGPYAYGAYAKDLESGGRLDEAAHYYALATKGPQPLPHACFNITEIHLLRNDPANAIAEGERALRAGCERSGKLLGPLSLAYALMGRWSDATQIASEIALHDPTGKSQVASIAAAAHTGDLEPLWAELAKAPPESADQLVSFVATVLQVGGDAERAQWVIDQAKLRAP